MLVSGLVSACVRRPYRLASAQRGLTLVEALVVMSIMTILLAVAMPSFSDFTRDQRIRAAGYDLVSDLLLARSEAIKRGAQVSIVGAGEEWTNGWAVRVDGGLHAGSIVQQRGVLGAKVGVSGVSTLSFDRNGRLASGGTTQFALVDKASGEQRRCIVIDLSGMPQSRAGACS